MNRSDFFRRLGLAVAALFAPKAVEGHGNVFKDCTAQHAPESVWFENNVITSSGHGCDFSGTRVNGHCTITNNRGITSVHVPEGHYRIKADWLTIPPNTRIVLDQHAIIDFT